MIAIIAIPLTLLILGRLFIFDPYYWYVLANKARFTAEAKSAFKAGSPVFAVIETRDVSIGMVTTPPTFVSIIYDESDEILLDPSARSPEWRTFISSNASTPYPQEVLSAPQLMRHLWGFDYKEKRQAAARPLGAAGRVI
jgi:hypothetical protein